MGSFARVAAFSLVASGCIEGPEAEALHDITPRQCETGLAADATFVISSNIPSTKLAADPPRFVLQGAQTIELSTTVGEFGELTLTPLQPLPADTDLMLRVADPGYLESTMIPGWLPTRYTTRNAPAIRSFRSIEGRVFVSFSQRLDAATVPTATSVRQGTAPVSAEATYLDAPGHVVWVETTKNVGLADIAFAPSLRTDRGDALFSVERTVQVDLAYTVPADDGCQYAE
jgi:hypothetical protein